jgi:protein-L-isoaspartate O-methyltransferase
MIEQQIRPWEVLDPLVLALLASIRREDFVPAAHKALAFVDMELPLGQPAVDGETMLAPASPTPKCAWPMPPPTTSPPAPPKRRGM